MRSGHPEPRGAVVGCTRRAVQRPGQNGVLPVVVDSCEDLCGALVADLDAGFEEVFRSYEAIVYTVARRFVSGSAEAEDLAADAFLRAYRALRGYDQDRIRELRLRPWLLTILRNAARNRVRDASRRPGPPQVTAGPVEMADTGPSIEHRFEQQEASLELEALLLHLPEIQRTALVLRHVVGLSIAEVAEVLGCPDGTAKSHVSRGLHHLRAQVGSPGKEVR